MNDKASRIALNERFLAASVTVVTFLVYLTTMCRTVSFIDAGELATVASVLGIAHPTGYPLFSLIAHCALWIPIGGEEVLRLNVFSAVVTALSVGVFFRILVVLGRMSQTQTRKDRTGEPKVRPATLLASAIAALAFGFSTTVWAQSVAIEVYGLHLLLLSVTILLFLKGIEESVWSDREIPRRLFASVFFLGLSFSNHLTTLLIVPALIYLYLATHGWRRESFFCAVRLSPFFFLGLSPYLYLPIRAGAHPPLEWGYPVGFERILWHVSGKQYRNWMFSSFDSAEKQLSYFFNHFTSEYNLLIVAAMLFGVWFTFRLDRRIFWFLVVAFAGCLFYSINYDIHDIDSYFLLAYLVAGVFLFFGILGVQDFFPTLRPTRSFFAFSLVLLAPPISQFAANRKEVSEADNYLVSDYVHNIFSNAQKNALVLTFQWDYAVAASFYYQFVRHEREDLVIVDKELLRRSWYFIYLEDHFPWLIERSKAEVDPFLAELYKFEHDLPYDPNVIEARYVGMINSFIEKSIKDRRVYLGPEIEPELGTRYSRAPAGLTFQLLEGVDTSAISHIKIDYRPTSFESRLTTGLRGIYARMLTSTAARFIARRQPSDALDCIDKALAVDPTFAAAKTLREQINQGARLGR